MEITCVVVQPCASVIVQVYVFALSPLAEEPVPPDGAHAYVYGPVPPEAVTEAVPFAPPLQETFVCACVALSTVGCVIVTTAVPLQELASVTVTVYVPALSPDAVAAFPPDGAHE